MGSEIQKIKTLNEIEEEDLGRYFDLIHKLDKDDEISDPRCKFCNSKHRCEAESIWDETQRFKPILGFFEKQNEDMNLRNVRNHIRNHYLRQEQMIMRRHYQDHILLMINYKISKLKRIQTFLAFL